MSPPGTLGARIAALETELAKLTAAIDRALLDIRKVAEDIIAPSRRKLEEATDGIEPLAERVSSYLSGMEARLSRLQRNIDAISLDTSGDERDVVAPPLVMLELGGES